MNELLIREAEERDVEAIVRLHAIPPYILPAPSLIGATMVADWPLLQASRAWAAATS